MVVNSRLIVSMVVSSSASSLAPSFCQSWPTTPQRSSPQRSSCLNGHLVVLSQRSSHHQHRLVTSFCQWPASFCGLSVGRLLLLSLSSLSFHSSPPVVVTVSHLASLSFYSSPPVVVVAFSCWHRSLLLSLHSSCLLLSSLSSLGWLSYTNNKTSAISGYTTRKDKRQESLLIAKDLPWPSCLLSSAH